MKLLYIVLVAALLSILLMGCQQSPSISGSVTDDLGRSVTMKNVPQRIISLAPSNTEIVYALGLADRLIGVTTYCNYPPEAQSKPQVAEFSVVDIEKIISLQPDLILATDIHKTDTIPALEKSGIPVLAFFPNSLSRMLEDISIIGRAAGKTAESETLVSSLEKRIKAITDKTAGLIEEQKPRVLLLTWHDPLWTMGAGTTIDDMIAKAGGVNIAHDIDGSQTINLESVIDRNPQVIVVMTGMGDAGAAPFIYVKTDSRFQVTDAVKNGRVFQVDTDIFGRATPRLIGGLEQLAALVHPELFK
jgi:iron complex transport system substrate-binding protein